MLTLSSVLLTPSTSSLQADRCHPQPAVVSNASSSTCHCARFLNTRMLLRRPSIPSQDRLRIPFPRKPPVIISSSPSPSPTRCQRRRNILLSPWSNAPAAHILLFASSLPAFTISQAPRRRLHQAISVDTVFVALSLPLVVVQPRSWRSISYSKVRPRSRTSRKLLL